jgi:hypothetical protein
VRQITVKLSWASTSRTSIKLKVPILLLALVWSIERLKEQSIERFLYPVVKTLITADANMLLSCASGGAYS